jgi:hypothetical protein
LPILRSTYSYYAGSAAWKPSGDGKQVFYRLADARVLHAVAALQRDRRNEALPRFSQTVRKHFLSLDGTEAVSRSELARLMKDNAVTVIDVRSERRVSWQDIFRAR